jgi:eukaryotic-like serine/threonine-protein kinase
MGEVWRARDSRLGREVALKLLPVAFANDPDRMARFQREARLLASLNHPAIATIHGLEESDGLVFLVLELVPGPTLAERLESGPLPVEESLRVALRVAEALEAAHRGGVVHRDLKPANVKASPDGTVKVLDFGLAKALSPATEEPLDTLAATRSQANTAIGTILGTPGYMSPEQARGRTVDEAADLWALGCLLFEMLTGRPSFRTDSVVDSLAAVLDREPEWTRMPSGVPSSVRRLLRACLEKDPLRRLRDARQARETLAEALSPGGARLPRWAWVAGVAALLALGGVAIWQARGSAPAAPTRLVQATFAEGIEGSPAWSPDGKRLAFVAESDGLRHVFVKTLETGAQDQVTHGHFDDIQPAWTPDGAALLFVRAREEGRTLQPGDVFGIYSGGDVWEVDAASGRETRLVANAFNPAPSPDGSRIAVDAAWAGPRRIWTVDRRGLNPQQVTADVTEAVDHIRPRWSPDGSRIVFQNLERTRFDVRVVDLATKSLTWVTNDIFRDVHPSWGPGFLCFSSDRSGGGYNLWRVAVSAAGEPRGAPQQLTTGAGQDVECAPSADGRRLAFSVLRQNADVWRLPVSPETGKPTGRPEAVIASTREDSRGAWSPDGRSIAFNSDRDGEMHIWLHSVADGTTRPLTSGPGGDFQPNWSPDGRTIVFFSSRSGSVHVWSVDVASGTTRQLTRGSSMNANPFYSPDGEHLAFHSDRSGRMEVWVARADGSETRQLSRDGAMGHFMRWTADGRFIVFRCPCEGRPRTERVAVDGGAAEPTAEVQGGSHMSFSPDGRTVMDAVGHRALWASPLASGRPVKVFEFEEPDARVDYPVWSPDGRFILFDRFRPQGGDVWILETGR